MVHGTVVGDGPSGNGVVLGAEPLVPETEVGTGTSETGRDEVVRIIEGLS